MLAYSGPLIEGRLALVELPLKLTKLEHHILPGPTVQRSGLVLSSLPAEVDPALPPAIGSVPNGALTLASATGHCKCAMACMMVRGHPSECANELRARSEPVAARRQKILTYILVGLTLLLDSDGSVSNIVLVGLVMSHATVWRGPGTLSLRCRSAEVTI